MKSYKTIVKDIIVGKSISMIELNTFIVEYVHTFKNVKVSDKQLEAIRQLIINGYFDIKYAAMQAAPKLNLEVVLTKNVDGSIIRADIYDK